MRTNIPHGMSQNNRAHPFFILLRKFAHTEELGFRKLVNHVYINIGITTLASLFLLFFSGIRIPAFLGIPIFTLVHYIVAHRRLDIIVNNLVFPKVNAMLSGDDYSGATLNYEKVINMIGIANWNIGVMDEFYRSSNVIRNTIVGIVIGVVAFQIVNLIV